MWFCPSSGYLFPLISCSDPSSWSVLPHRLNGLLTFEVDEGEVTQAVVLHDQAGDYVNRGLSFPSTESTCDVSPVGRGVCCRKDTSRCHWSPVYQLKCFTSDLIYHIQCSTSHLQLQMGQSTDANWHARTHTHKHTENHVWLIFIDGWNITLT